MTKKYYVTTPIYYANGAPHIGHAYASFLADIFARSKRLLGYNVKFSTGVDENGQKMIQKAQEIGKSVNEFLDEIYESHIETWTNLNISYTDYIRTTEKRHHEFVRKMIDICERSGDIYKGKYEGLYCVGCESFKKETDLIKNEKGELICPDHLKKPDLIVEENYFFKLSKYQDFLKNLYTANSDFVNPGFRFNEVKSFVNGGLDDFSISRPSIENDFRIKFPLDETQVVYIWFDALFNYLTVCQDGDEGYWPSDVHVMAKDIVKFHSVYWPAMLKSAGYEMPKKLVCTGYFTVDGQKMSKTIGNVIEPNEIVNKYGRDPVLFYLFYDINIGNDGDFSWERFKGLYNSTLLGGWGNLVSRVVSLSQKNGIEIGKSDKSRLDILKNYLSSDKSTLIGTLNDLGLEDVSETIASSTENNLFNLFESFDEEIFEKYFTDVNFTDFLKDLIELINISNKFMQDSQPWTKLKDDSTKEDGIKDLQFLLYMIRQIGILSSPFLVDGFEKLKNILGNNALSSINTGKDGGLEDGKLKEIFDTKEFPVNLSSGYLYTKVEELN